MWLERSGSWSLLVALSLAAIAESSYYDDPRSGNQQGSSFKCTEEGYHADPRDCTVYYRCVDFGNGGPLVKYRFECGPGTVFSKDQGDICTHPDVCGRPECGGTNEQGDKINDVDSNNKPGTEKEKPGNQGKPESQPSPTPPRGTCPSCGPPRGPGSAGTTAAVTETTARPTQGAGSTVASVPTAQGTAQGPDTPNIGTECTCAGFLADPQDCTKFYRCVDEGNGSFRRYEFNCGEGTVWDPKTESCNHPWAANRVGCRSPGGSNPPGQSSHGPGSTAPGNGATEPTMTVTWFPGSDSTGRPTGKPPGSSPSSSQPTPAPGSTAASVPPTQGTGQGPNTPNVGTECTCAGFMADPEDCTKFYRCVDEGNGSFRRYEFNCGEGTVWDPKIESCNHPWAANRVGCQGPGGSNPPGQSSHGPGSSAPGHGTTEPTVTITWFPGSDSTGRPTGTAPGVTPSSVGPSQGSSSSESPTGATAGTTSSSVSPGQGGSSTGAPSGTPPSSGSPGDGGGCNSGPGTTPGKPTGSSCSGRQCKTEGFMEDAQDCQKFYRCVGNGKGSFTRYDFTCGVGTTWDQKLLTCVHPWESSRPECRDSGASNPPQGSTHGPESTGGPPSQGASTAPPAQGSTQPPSSEGSSTVPPSQGSTEASPSGETSTAPPSEATTVPPSEATTVPSSEATTVPPSEATTVPSSEATTVPPSEATTVPPSEATTVPPSEATTVPPSEATTVPPSEATTVPPSEATTVPPSEATTLPPSEATTVPPSEATTVPPSEATTVPPSEATTVPSSEATTVPSSEATTVPPSQGSTEVPPTEGTSAVPSSEGSSTLTPSQGTSEGSPTGGSTSPSQGPAGSSPTASPPSSCGSCPQCKGEGFFPNEKDCTKFYRCVKNERSGYRRFDFDCGPGTAWDQGLLTCNYIHQVATCKGQNTAPSQPAGITSPGSSSESSSSSSPSSESSTSSSPSESSTSSSSSESSSSGSSESGSSSRPCDNPASNNGIVCNKEGFFPNPDYCGKFYRCVDNGNGFSVYHFDCAPGTIFDPSISTCNHASAVYPPRNCKDAQGTQPGPGTTDASTNGAPDCGSTPSSEVTTTGPPSGTSAPTASSSSETATEASSSGTSNEGGESTSQEEPATTPQSTSSPASGADSSGTPPASQETTAPPGPSSTEGATSQPPPAGSVICPVGNLTGEQIVLVCPTGFRRHPKYCNIFYQCTSDADMNVKVLSFHCPENTIFDNKKIECVPEEQSSEPCAGVTAGARVYRRVEQSPTSMVHIEQRETLCPDQGYYPYNEEECSNVFYKCMRDEERTLQGYLYKCPEDFVFWPVSRRCERSSRLPMCLRKYNNNRNEDDFFESRWSLPEETFNRSARKIYSQRA
ncbi:mucin-5AC-like [Venturia canescens]|uniref:mucin-5AC-like n=1 Tax=Venturia canescens TaxID=32260 RepID=UPI001C9C6746|nr:mucin-5AC-like [Venturia canescens]XP_043280233.1 mucin-5AC-like [Venturia canescens]XP_043280234.1 mucin-5AC-like [Venturia canescens]